MEEITHLSLFSGIGGLDLAAEWSGMRTIGQCEWAEYPARVLEKHWPDIPRWKDIRTLTEESFYERTGRRTVDVISGGFPCQPFSVAGKQRGKEDDRYLWPEMVRVIKELRPAWVVGENVAGIVRMELPNILSELEGCGYRTRTFLIPACAVGARHRRYRVAIVGHTEHNGLSPAAVRGGAAQAGRREQEGQTAAGEPAGAGRPRNREAVGGAENLENPGGIRCGEPGDVHEQQGRAEPERSGKDMADTHSAGLQTERAGKQAAGAAGAGGDVADTMRKLREFGRAPEIEAGEPEPADGGQYVPYTNDRGRDVRRIRKLPQAEETEGEWDDIGGGTEEHEPRERRAAQPGLGGVADGLPGWVDGYWDIEPDIPRVAEGIPHRADRIKALGNAVVPQQFYPVFKAIAEVERSRPGS